MPKSPEELMKEMSKKMKQQTDKINRAATAARKEAKSVEDEKKK